MGVGGQRHAPAAFTPGKDPVPIVQKAGLDRCGKTRPHRDSIPGPSSPLRVAIPTALSRPLFVGKMVGILCPERHRNRVFNFT